MARLRRLRPDAASRLWPKQLPTTNTEVDDGHVEKFSKEVMLLNMNQVTGKKEKLWNAKVKTCLNLNLMPLSFGKQVV